MEEFTQALEARFADAADFTVRRIDTPSGAAAVCSIDGLTGSGDIADFILRPLSRGEAVCNAVESPVRDAADAAEKLVCGFCVVLLSGSARAYEVKSAARRGPEPPTVESTVKGAKDAFTETLRTNTALVRRHLRTPSVQLWERPVGSRSATRVAVVSLEGVTDIALRDRVIARLEGLEPTGLLTPAAVEEGLTGARKTAFPMLRYTERPDKFCQGLLAGQVGVLVDALPLGYLLPVDLAVLMSSPEDYGMDYVTASCVRVLRYLALLAALLLPGLFVAMMAFQPEMIPTKLLQSIIESKQGVPFPATLEVLGLLVAFELLQEAGIHLPQAIGHTISIIGGLVVGTAAVEARILSPAALIVVAAAGICGYCLPSRDFSNAVRVWRFGLALCAGAAGLFGLTAGAVALLIHLAELESLGRPYLAPFCRAELGGALSRARVERR